MTNHPSHEPEMPLSEAKARVETLATKPRVTEQSIIDKIHYVEYTTSMWHTQLTICIIHMRNSFCVVGKSAPVYSENFDPEVGKRFAYDDAFKQLWPLEGYLLAEKRPNNTPNTPNTPYEAPPTG